MLIKQHPSYVYCKNVVTGKIPAPRYVKLQAQEFLDIADDKLHKYVINIEMVEKIDRLLALFIMPKGLRAGETMKSCLAGFQYLLIVGTLCVVHREDNTRRRYRKAVLEIGRKAGKTQLIGVIMILLLFLEPKFSKFYSVAPDGSLSREVKSAMQEIISVSPALSGTYQNKLKFKILRDSIKCNITESEYIPLNFSTSRLDGRLAQCWMCDETGALSSPYPIEAMSSSQISIRNPLGFVISTKYPTIQNPLEDEVEYAKKVLDKQVEDETIFALLYEPDNKTDWATDDGILEQANPLALDIPEIMADLKQKRAQAIEVPSKRENFITKHCNIIYSGIGTESYVSLDDLKSCRSKSPINWKDREVYVGVDLSMSNDNCSVSMVGYDEDTNTVLIKTMAFIPEGKIDEKSKLERVSYRDYINCGWCIACGDRTVDYSVIEDYVLKLEDRFGVKIHSLGYDRYNAISSAQKFEKGGIVCVEIRQHSSLLHAPTKWLAELIENKQVLYDEDRLLELNFDNSRCTYDTNLNRYVNKKKSTGKVDEVVATINALYLMQQNVILNNALDWVVQT